MGPQQRLVGSATPKRASGKVAWETSPPSPLQPPPPPPPPQLSETGEVWPGPPAPSVRRSHPPAEAASSSSTGGSPGGPASREIYRGNLFFSQRRCWTYEENHFLEALSCSSAWSYRPRSRRKHAPGHQRAGVLERQNFGGDLPPRFPGAVGGLLAQRQKLSWLTRKNGLPRLRLRYGRKHFPGNSIRKVPGTNLNKVRE